MVANSGTGSKFGSSSSAGNTGSKPTVRLPTLLDVVTVTRATRSFIPLTVSTVPSGSSRKSERDKVAMLPDVDAVAMKEDAAFPNT